MENLKIVPNTNVEHLVICVSGSLITARVYLNFLGSE